MLLSLLYLLTLSPGELTVMADSAAALCPDQARTEHLVNDRLQQSAPPNHSLHYELVVDAQSGKSYVRVRLYNAESAILLERLIPVQDNDCSDVPLAISIIVERYLQALPQPTSDLTIKSEEGSDPSGAEQPTTTSKRSDSQATQQESPAKEEVVVPPSNEQLRFMGRAGLSVGKGAIPFFTFGLNYFFAKRGYVDLSFDLQLHETSTNKSGYSIASIQHGMSLGSGYYLPLLKSLAWSVGPAVELHFQRAGVHGTNVVGATDNWRVVPAISLKSDLYFSFTRVLGLVGGGRVGVWLWGPHFLVTQANGPDVELLPLPALEWDVHLALSYRF